MKKRCLILFCLCCTVSALTFGQDVYPLYRSFHFPGKTFPEPLWTGQNESVCFPSQMITKEWQGVDLNLVAQQQYNKTIQPNGFTVQTTPLIPESNKVQLFVYDDLHRIIQIQEKAISNSTPPTEQILWTNQYFYRGNTNLFDSLHFSVTGTLVTAHGFTYNNNDQLVQTRQHYEPAGNPAILLIWQDFSYNSSGQLTEVIENHFTSVEFGKKFEFAYNAQNALETVLVRSTLDGEPIRKFIYAEYADSVYTRQTEEWLTNTWKIRELTTLDYGFQGRLDSVCIIRPKDQQGTDMRILNYFYEPNGTCPWQVSDKFDTWDFDVHQLHFFDYPAVTHTNAPNPTLDLAVFPNPAQDHLLVSAPLDAQLELYNQLGQTVWTGRAAGATRIAVAQLPRGTYWLAARNGEGRGVQRVLLR